MAVRKVRCCWRKDLADFRGLSELDRLGFLPVLEWFENFRLRYELEDGSDAAKAFWRMEVVREDRPRVSWHLKHWEDAIKWYLNWLSASEEEGGEHRSLPEQFRAEMRSAGARRGQAPGTKACYGSWAVRYATFAGGEREAMQLETASRFLTSVLEDENCAYSTQKQALNAIGFLFKNVLGVVDPVFNVKLSKTGSEDS